MSWREKYRGVFVILALLNTYLFAMGLFGTAEERTSGWVIVGITFILFPIIGSQFKD